MSLLTKPFVFLRHGETFYNRARIIAGRFDVPLTPEGEQQARDVQELLDRPWSYIAVSSMFRARKTARLAIPGGRFHIFDGLRERDWGDLEGKPYRHPMPYTSTSLPGGESWDVFQTRVIGAINEVLAHHEYPLFVAHSGVFRVIRFATLGTHEGPRVKNVCPVVCTPGEGSEGWSLTSMSDVEAFEPTV
ncbi:histidine phosphatase family protein [Larsenimonas suaedae]|uniref:Histidine phosphatase family protein n=1 Tax=Larsenimonas suaedae TaxID=1851019 RepID=A0ABU1GTA7_9GAMM|nr:histidine phosphatase family protein [Larsenimonas suaedae]MCM2971719.1 histidine phosphatase family protein [Larsenimonas suaedae]MDR5895271.1 histidine phosphatase family protein [Larsenimonas suaedae]